MIVIRRRRRRRSGLSQRRRVIIANNTRAAAEIIDTNHMTFVIPRECWPGCSRGFFYTVCMTTEYQHKSNNLYVIKCGIWKQGMIY